MSVNVPNGYKQTKVGVIPEDWKVVRLGDVLMEKPKYGINAPAVEYSKSLPTYLRITDIDENGIFNTDKKVSVNDKNSCKYILQENDIVFARTGATVGKSYLYNENDGELVYAGFLIKATPNPEKLNSVFLKNYTATNRYWGWIRIMSARSGQPGVNGEEYSLMPIPLPPLKEQQKIAQILTTWDEAISKQKALIAEKEQLKKGLMQKLLSGEVRFGAATSVAEDNATEVASPEWEEVRLGDVSAFYKGKGISKNDIADDGIECVRYGELYTKYGERIETVISKTFLPNKNLFLSKKNDILIPASGETAIDLATASCITKDDVAIGGDINIIRTKMNGIFLSYYLNTIAKKKIASLAQGVSVIHLYSKQLKSLKIKLPPLEEQQKIAQVLTTADKEIKLLKEELEALKEQKRGLMQKLLTGEVRVKI